MPGHSSDSVCRSNTIRRVVLSTSLFVFITSQAADIVSALRADSLRRCVVELTGRQASYRRGRLMSTSDRHARAALSTRRAFRRPLNDLASGGGKSGPAGRQGREMTTTTTSLLLHDNIPMATRRAPNTKQSIVNVGDSLARSLRPSSPPTLQLSRCSRADPPSVRFVCTLLLASLAHT